MAAVNLSPLFNGYQAFSPAGLPLTFGTIDTFIAGSSTPLATYTTAAGNVANSNPIVLLADGRPPQEIWLIQGGAYRFVLKDALGNQIGTYDDIAGIEASGGPGSLRTQLADTTSASNGAGLVGFNYALNYAVSTVGWVLKAGAKNLNAFVGVDATGVADSTAAIQAVLNMGGSCYGTGIYKTTSQLTMSVAGTYYVGSGLTSNQIYQQSLGAKIFNVTADNCGVSGVMLDYNGTPTAGATAIYSSGSNTEHHSFKVNRAYIGVHLTTGNSQQAHHFQVYSAVSIGAWVVGTGDAFVDTFIIDGVNTTNHALGGLRLENFCEAAQISNGDILNGAYSLVTDAASYVAGSRPAYCTFTSVYGDSSVNGSRIDKAALLTFDQCWFSAGRSGPGNAGCALIQTEGIVFLATKFVNSGSHGLFVGALAANTILDACQAQGNSVTAGAAVAHGVLVDTGNDGFQVRGGQYKNSFFAGSQAYGIAISATCTNYSIIGADCRGNATGAIFDGSAATSGRISDNLGYNPVGATSITLGASPYTYTAGHSPETVYIDGGTVSSIATGGQTMFTATGKTVTMGPNETVTVTYTVLPGMKKYIH